MPSTSTPDRHAPTTRAIGAGALAVAALAAAGCGSSSSPAHQAAASAPATAPAQTTAAVAVAPSVRILTPHRNAHTGRTVTVHVHLTGARNGPHVLRYVLDGALARSGSDRLTYTELAPGRHHLVVLLADDAGVHATSTFVVSAPAPTTVVPTTATPTTTSTPEMSPPSSAAPPPTPTHTSPPPATSSPAPPPPATGIPQRGGGDGDADNSGGPTDGDGNV
jgi:hypothetical protein